MCKLGEGAFSEVWKAHSVKTNKYVAIKCMKKVYDNVEEVNTVREIHALQRLSPHPHVITLFEYIFDEPTGRLALVFEIMDMNLYELISG
jgi:renal tumor antigen